jgi:phosphate transport system substrate-binding protein
MFTWSRSIASILALSFVIMLAIPVTAAEDGGLAPAAVSGHEQDGNAVLSWLPPSASPAMINQTGCDSMNMSMSYVYENFTALYPNITVVLRGGGNDVGFAKWIAGDSDVDQASRRISAEERQQAEAKGINVTETKAGVESVAIIADPRSGVTEISFEQLRGLLSGSIANWKELGGADLEVRIFMPRPVGSPYLFINKSVMAGTPFASSATTVDDGRELTGRVAGTSGAVGFVRAGFVDDSSGVRCLSVRSGPDGAAYAGNDTAAAYNGTYALARYYYLYTNGSIQGAQGTWATFILDSSHGQKILRDNGFLPLLEGDRTNSTRNIVPDEAVSGYHIVRRSSDGTMTEFNASSTRFVDSNVTKGATYTYTVSAMYGSGQGPGSSPVTVTVPEAGATAGAGSSSSSLLLMIAVVALVAAVVTVLAISSRRR